MSVFVLSGSLRFLGKFEKEEAAIAFADSNCQFDEAHYVNDLVPNAFKNFTDSEITAIYEGYCEGKQARNRTEKISRIIYAIENLDSFDKPVKVTRKVQTKTQFDQATDWSCF